MKVFSTSLFVLVFASCITASAQSSPPDAVQDYPSDTSTANIQVTENAQVYLPGESRPARFTVVKKVDNGTAYFVLYVNSRRDTAAISSADSDSIAAAVSNVVQSDNNKGPSFNPDLDFQERGIYYQLKAIDGHLYLTDASGFSAPAYISYWHCVRDRIRIRISDGIITCLTSSNVANRPSQSVINRIVRCIGWRALLSLTTLVECLQWRSLNAESQND